MSQSYKIHLNGNVVYLMDDAQWLAESPKLQDNERLIHYQESKELNGILQKLSGDFKNQVFYVVGRDIETVKRDFFNNYKLVIAGGGVVFNKYKEILFIFRNGFWDLPKGKIELGENIKEGAMREVEEETGVKVKGILLKVGCSYHTYSLDNNNILKETHWFAMRGKTKSVFKPQAKEGIVKVEWVKQDALAAYLDHSYPNIRDVVEDALKTTAAQQSL
jgi:8-oxo-dGTP pyrophosphatase MutT (NUDIX family)